MATRVIPFLLHNINVYFSAPTGISAPISVTPLQDGRSVEVVWSPPERPNGLIIFYNLIARNRAKPSDTVVTKVNDVETFNATMAGLTPYTRYDITITAFTSGGNGTSPSVNVTTLQAGWLSNFLYS